MARHWWTMLVLSFSNFSWDERDVDKGRPTIKRNVSELANLPMEGYFSSLIYPLGWFTNLEGESLFDIDETPFLHVQR